MIFILEKDGMSFNIYPMSSTLKNNCQIIVIQHEDDLLQRMKIFVPIVMKFYHSEINIKIVQVVAAQFIP